MNKNRIKKRRNKQKMKHTDKIEGIEKMMVFIKRSKFKKKRECNKTK